MIAEEEQVSNYRATMKDRWLKKKTPVSTSRFLSMTSPSNVLGGDNTSAIGASGGRVGGGKRLTMDELKAKMDNEYYIRKAEHYLPEVKTVVIDSKSLSSIMDYVKSSGHPRCGYLYGVINSEKGEACVDSIYEPPQDIVTSLPLEDGRKERVGEVVKLIGMKPLGMIVTNDEGVLDANNVEHMLTRGLGYIAIVMKNAMEVTAFQLSKQCIELWEKKIIVASPKTLTMQGKKMNTSAKVSVNGKECKEIEVERLIVPIGIKQKHENDVIDNYV